MKVLLSTPPGETTELWPPLGLLYVASCVKSQRQDEIKVVDSFCENLSPTNLIKRVVAEKPDVFGINCSTHTFLDSIEVMKGLKSLLPETKLVLGGYHATFAAERIIREYPFVDYLIKGEGERSFPKLLQRIDDSAPPTDVEGISFLSDGDYVSNPFTLIDDLDSLPFPDRALAQAVKYGYFFQNIQLTFGKFTSICSSRGCPYRCTYCSCAELSLRKWRPRSAENVVDEIESLYEQGYECCVFIDDNFTHRKKRVEDICRMIRERKIDMQYFCEGRVDGAPYELMQTMKRTGFNVMYFGVESASPHVLDYYQKHVKPEQSVQAIRDAKRAGMIVVTSYILGAPIENKEDIERTIDMIGKTRPHGVQLNILDCLIGTPIWNDLEKDGKVGKDDWKTNHRIYEYIKEEISKEDLRNYLVDGYSAYIDSWKTRSGIRELMRLLLTNSTARKIVFGNILNADARTLIFEGLRPKEEKSADGEARPDAPRDVIARGLKDERF